MDTAVLSSDAEIARIRGIVQRQELPAFVTGFDVRFGDDFGTPVVLVAFKTVGLPEDNEAAIRARAAALHDLRLAVQHDLSAELHDLSPRFRFERAADTSRR